jgi:hypothetical protein
MSIIIGGNILDANDLNPSGNTVNVPNVVTRDLVLWLDAGNNSSYINSSNYYDCGYGCMYYSSNPGCTNCNTQWKDISGFGNDWGVAGTYNGTHFTYNSTQLSRAASSDWATTAERTIDTWFYPTSGGIHTGCCETIFGSYYFRFFMIGQSIYTMIGFANGDGSYNTYQHPAFTLSYNAWHHIVGMRRGNNYIIWVDGVEMYNTTFGSGLILYDPYGTYYMSNPNHSNVRIASAKIYKRGLTDAEILQNFNAGRQRFGI